MMKLGLIFLFSFLFSHGAFAQGGPPMITDDPGTPGDGNWEINVASLGFKESGHASVNQTPYIDANYGFGERLQLKYESALNRTSTTDAPVGGQDAIAGVKWRFYDNPHQEITVSTYPQYSFRPFYYSQPLPDTSSPSFYLPLNLVKKVGAWSYNPELGYTFTHDNQKLWSLGLLASYEFNENFEVMAELFSQWQAGHSSNNEIICNVGSRITISDEVVLLLSAGHSLSSFAGISSFMISYLGIQLKIE